MDISMSEIYDKSNAQAGPSNINSYPAQTQAIPGPMTIPPVFLPPPPHPVKLPPFSASQDLIGFFKLQAAYDKYVKPHTLPVDQWHTSSPNTAKGKGREKDTRDDDINMDASSPNDPSNSQDDPSKEGKKRKKEGTYKHLIKAIVGKHSMKKDTYLVDTISVPPKQKMDIKKFEDRGRGDPFWVSPEGLHGYNIYTLAPDTEQAREDRRRRKEARKAEKARAMALSAGLPDPTLTTEAAQPALQAPTPMTNGAPTPAASSSVTNPTVHVNGTVTKKEGMGSRPNQGAPSQAKQNGKPPTSQSGSTPTGQRSSTPVNKQSIPQKRARTPQQQSQQPAKHQQQRPPQQQQRLTTAPAQSRINHPSLTHTPEVINSRGTKRDRPETPLSQHHPSSHTHSAAQVFPHSHGMSHPTAAKKRRLESATAVR